MSVVFDGSSGAPAVGVQPGHQGDADLGVGEEVDLDGPVSTLDLLRQRVEEREAEAAEEWVHEIRGIGIRIVCDTNVDHADYQAWLKAAAPRSQRRRGALDPTDVDQLAISARAIAKQCLRLEIEEQRNPGTWNPMTSKKTHEVLLLTDDEMLRTFNCMDPIALLRKLFPRDSDLLNAGQDLLQAAGYMDRDDDSDPLEPAPSGSPRRSTS